MKKDLLDGAKLAMDVQTFLLHSRSAVFSEMRAHGELTDVLLKSKTKTIAAHRLVLSGGCPFFRAMFRSEMIESNGLVNLDYLEPEVIETIVDYFYTGSIIFRDSSTKDIKNVLEAAHFFQLDDVFNYCLKQLIVKLGNDSFLDLYEVSVTYHMHDIIETISNFLVGHFSSVITSSEFLKMSIEQLEMILPKLAKHWWTDQVAQGLSRWCQKEPQNRPFQLISVFANLLNVVYIIPKDICTTETVLLQALKALKKKPIKVSEIDQPGFNLVCFGVEEKGATTMSVFNLETNSWNSRSLPFQVDSASAVVANQNKIYFFGGFQGKTHSKAVFTYWPQADSYQQLHDLKVGVSSAGAVAFYDSIYIIGGENGNNNESNMVQKFSLDDGTTRIMPHTIFAHWKPVVCSTSRHIYAMGSGFTDGGLEKFDPSFEQWTVMEKCDSLNLANLSSCCGTMWKNRLFVIPDWSKPSSLYYMDVSEEVQTELWVKVTDGVKGTPPQDAWGIWTVSQAPGGIPVLVVQGRSNKFYTYSLEYNEWSELTETKNPLIPNLTVILHDLNMSEFKYATMIH